MSSTAISRLPPAPRGDPASVRIHPRPPQGWGRATSPASPPFDIARRGWNDRSTSERPDGGGGMFTGVKVFSATKAKERDDLGEQVTRWLRANSDLEIVDRTVVLSYRNKPGSRPAPAKPGTGTASTG